MMKVLVVGSGGREHALGWKLARCERVDSVLFAPGNGGTGAVGRNIQASPDSPTELLQVVESEGVGLTVIGPERPIAGGIAEHFARVGARIFAPGRKAARLEASKAYGKSFARRHDIPTAPFEAFDDFDDARDYVVGAEYPLVVKADGLAAGKGVSVVRSKGEAIKALEECMVWERFAEAGHTVVIESFLKGRELSLFVIADGKDYSVLGYALDYKRLCDGGAGPNTGGMGALAPPPGLNPELAGQVIKRVVEPTFRGLKEDGTEYVGFLYFGLMLVDGAPHLLEYNVRLGDPETQALLPLLDIDLLEAMDAALLGELGAAAVESRGASVCVVAASEGYPGSPKRGAKITVPVAGLEEQLLFHAGTKEVDGELRVNGGRVLSAVGTGKSLEDARARAYDLVGNVQFDGMQYRSDIGAF